MSKTWSVLLPLGAVCLLAGCGGGEALYPVTGKVAIEGSGPLGTGEVVFTSQKATARGAIQKDGTFRLKTSGPKERDGAPPGKYQAAIVGAAEYTDAADLSKSGKLLIDAKFGDYRTSGLEYTVEEKSNAFEIAVTKPAG